MDLLLLIQGIFNTIFSKINTLFDFDFSNDVYFAFFFSFLFLITIKLMQNKLHFVLLTILLLPGTFFHELSHLLVSLILNGKPSSFNIIPKREDIFNEYGVKIGYSATLGEVVSQNIKWYNAFFIAFAPLLLFPLSFFLLSFVNFNNFNLYVNFSLIYLSSNLFFSSIPSKQDFKVGFYYKISSFFILSIISSLIYFYY